MKYLFTAHYKDGTCYKQNEQDISVNRSDKSSYYDIDHEKLSKFEIYLSTDPDKKIFVDLTNGEIVFNLGVSAKIAAPENISDFRLIYFRKNACITGGGNINTISFNIGWQANDINGKNVKNIIEIF